MDDATAVLDARRAGSALPVRGQRAEKPSRGCGRARCGSVQLPVAGSFLPPVVPSVSHDSSDEPAAVLSSKEEEDARM